MAIYALDRVIPSEDPGPNVLVPSSIAVYFYSIYSDEPSQHIKLIEPRRGGGRENKLERSFSGPIQ